MNTAKFELTKFPIIIAIISMLSISTLVQAKAPILPTICTKGGTASVIIKSVDLGDGYHAAKWQDGQCLL